MNVLYSGGYVDAIEGLEKRKGLKGTVYESSIVFCVYCASRKRTCLQVLQRNYVYLNCGNEM